MINSRLLTGLDVNPLVGSGSFESHGSGRIGSGRIRSGPEVLKLSRDPVRTPSTDRTGPDRTGPDRTGPGVTREV